MTIAVKITLAEQAVDPRTPVVEVSYIPASTRTPREETVCFLNPEHPECTVHVTDTRDIRISRAHQ